MENRKSLILDDPAAAAAAYTVDFDVANQESIVVWWTLDNAAAAADLTAASCLVYPYDPSGAEVLDIALTEDAVVVSGAFTSPIAATAKRYDARGLNNLQLAFTTTAIADVKIYVNSCFS